MSNISAVIRTYTEERWDDLVAAVRSVQTQTEPPAEIVIVVDHNTELLAKVRRAFPDVVAVKNAEPRGSSGGWNTGVAAAAGDILAFMDDDATAAPDWLAQLHAGYSEPRVVGVGGDIVPTWLYGRPNWFPEEFNWIVGCTYRGLAETESPVRNLIGCNMSFRREVFDLVGGFRGGQYGIGHLGGLPVGCDETEFCIRVRQQLPHSVTLYRPQAKVFHKVPAKRATWNYFRSRCYLEGRSKARVSKLVGSRDGLAAERIHAARTLPIGVLRAISGVVRYADVSGLSRALAIAVGLSLAASGFLAETAALRARRSGGPAIIVRDGQL